MANLFRVRVLLGMDDLPSDALIHVIVGRSRTGDAGRLDEGARAGRM
ncbi:hypothetical protein [Nonomuraea sp. LPB2021202275-12-8]